ncbi:MAG TPA: hypothetical protein VMD09_06315 [Solirubrobacteraceae bacterium]|nr:hypothetical protein [Solirubrobacteraceae bacterium]
MALIIVLGLAIAIAAGRHRTGHAVIPPSKSAPPAGIQFGANTGVLFNSGAYSPATIDAQLKALAATGVTVARSDAPWEATEPTPPSGNLHHYNWAFDDTIAGDLAANGLTWLPIIDYSAPWARAVPSQDHSAPDPAEYADYAGALAARYGPGGSFWQAHPSLTAHPVETYEIWNEPDNPVFWSPAPNPTAYANLYLSARDAIEAAQPSARVIVGGLTKPATFLPALVSAAPALRHQLDGVAIHPYGGSPQAVLDNVRTARSTLQSLGLGSVPLYVTEFGWTTSPPGSLDYLNARLRPSYIEQTLTLLGHTSCGLADVILYAWMTPERNRHDSQDWFGIHPPTGGGTPDTAAFAAGVHAAASGPTGPTGATGASGATGATGASSATGATGSAC